MSDAVLSTFRDFNIESPQQHAEYQVMKLKYQNPQKNRKSNFTNENAVDY